MTHRIASALKHYHKPLFFVPAILAIMLSNANAYAADPTHNVDLNLNISTVLHIAIPNNLIVLDLNPVNETPVFTTEDFAISVSTNNPTGYNLTLTAEKTDLIRNTSIVNGENLITHTIPTLAPLAGGYLENTFTTNRWGYKIGNNNYQSLATNATLKTTTDPASIDATNLTFAAKADIHQPAGVYDATLNFIATTNYVPEIWGFIQDMDLATCQATANDDSVVVIDSRDGKEYPVRYIDGNCWMTSNLRLAPGTELDSSTSNIAEGTTWTVPTDSTTNFWNDTNANGYTQPGVHIPTEANMTTINNYMITNNYPTLTATQIGAWYNFCAATAGTICYELSDSHAKDEAEYDICPAGWRLPTRTEQQFSGTAIIGGTNSASRFAPVAGGAYGSGSLSNLGYGGWWSATAYSASNRYGQLYSVSSGRLSYDYDYRRYGGLYVRCVRSS